VDKHAFDVRGRRGAGVKRCVAPVAELGSAVGVMQINDDICGIDARAVTGDA
jgi:hypothetical protein